MQAVSVKKSKKAEPADKKYSLIPLNTILEQILLMLKANQKYQKKQKVRTELLIT